MQIHQAGDSRDLATRLENSAFAIYEKEIYSEGISIMCSIHESFKTESEVAHNCIGCNFADFTDLLRSALKQYSEVSYPLETFSGSLWYAYLLVERFEQIFDIIQLPSPYKQKHFQIFSKIKRWTNFLKHPKAFILVHHPQYFFESDVTIEPKDKENTIIINQEFIDTYYSGDSQNAKLFSQLTNKKNVFVIFPNLNELITEFCVAQKRFIEIISKNQVFKEILDGKTTIKDYFEDTHSLREVES